MIRRRVASMPVPVRLLILAFMVMPMILFQIETSCNPARVGPERPSTHDPKQRGAHSDLKRPAAPEPHHVEGVYYPSDHPEYAQAPSPTPSGSLWPWIAATFGTVFLGCLALGAALFSLGSKREEPTDFTDV